MHGLRPSTPATLFAWFGFLLAPAQALGQLRIATYNTNNYASGETLPRTGIATVLEALGNQAKPGFARPVDILILQEQSTLSTSTQAYVDLLNSIYGAGVYARGQLQGSTTGGGRPAVVYNTQTVGLIAERQATTTSVSGGPRATLRYQFRPTGYDSAADFYVYASHFKAVDDTASAERRGVEAAQIRADADALGQGALAIYAGDMNFYRSSEIGFQTLLSPGSGQAFDPIDRVGSWSNSNAYRDVHSQSPVTSAEFSGQVTGGLDDRFDFQLVTGEVLDGRGFDYVPGSYWALGNTGTHVLNGPLSTGSVSALQALLPGSTSQEAAAVIAALMSASDHLPVVADYRLPAKLAVVAPVLPPAVLRGAEVGGNMAISNAAPVAVAAGADTLAYTITGSNGIIASGDGARGALSAPAVHAVGFDTTVAGLRNGVLSVRSASPQAASATFVETYSINVIDRASLSSTGDGGGGDGGGERTAFAGAYVFGGDGNVGAFPYNGVAIDGLVVSDLRKGGVTSSSSAGNFRATAWPTGGINGSDAFAGEYDPAKYLEFTLTAAAATTFDLKAVEFGIGRSGTGPRQWQWRSSVDSFAAPIGSFGVVSEGLGEAGGVLTTPDTNSFWNGNRLDLGDGLFQGLSAVTFRLYGFNAEGAGGTGGLQGPLTFSGRVVAAPAAEPTPAESLSGLSIESGGTITVSNAPAAAGTQRASATISSRTLVGDVNWSVGGLGVGETIAAGAAASGTVSFHPSGRLNGPHVASFTLGFEHSDQSLPGAVAGDLGTLAWNLAATVTGQTGSGTTIVQAGGSLAGLGLGSLGPRGTTSLLEAGQARATGPVTMLFEPPPTTGLFASDVLTLTGTGGTAVVLSLSFDAALGGATSAQDLRLGWLDTRASSPTSNSWINAVAGNTANSVTISEPFSGSWADYTTQFTVASPAEAVGAWGIDTSAARVWAVLDHASQFAVISLAPARLPGDANLDGQVDVFDLVMINTAGRYGTGTASTWAEGDFNADGVTNVFDLVVVNTAGYYGQGRVGLSPSDAGAAGTPAVVPEPEAWTLVTCAAAGLLALRRWRG